MVIMFLFSITMDQLPITGTEKDGAMVNAGDTVKTGQSIGLSGNTGYSAFPHLHFEVQGYDVTGNYKQLATRFRTNKGVIYLRPGKFYRATR